MRVRGVAYIFPGVRTVEKVHGNHGSPKARASEGFGGIPPKKRSPFRAWKCQFPSFLGNSSINQNMTQRRVFSNLRRLYVNLLLTGGPMRDFHRVKLTGKGRDFSPLDGKIRTLVCQCLRSYVCEYVELYFQRG